MPGLTILPGWFAPGQRKPFGPRWKGTIGSLVAGISNLRPQSIHSTVYFVPPALAFSCLSIIIFYNTVDGGVVNASAYFSHYSIIRLSSKKAIVLTSVTKWI